MNGICLDKQEVNMRKSIADPDELMDIKWVANRCKLAVSTIKAWIAKPKDPFPKGMKLGRSRKWRRGDIEDYLRVRNAA